MTLRINLKYKNIIPRPSREDYESLKQDIKERGQNIPIEINKERIILDGYTRFEICKELRIIPKTIERNFKTELEELEHIIMINRARRHLTDLQRVRMGMEIEKIEKIKASLREKSGKPTPKWEQGEAAEHAAKKVGLSRNTYLRGRTIIQSGDKKTIDKVDQGKQSINFAEKTIRHGEQKKLPPPKLGKGIFDLIEMDFPWKYGLELSGSPDYATMTAEEGMKQFPKLPDTENSILAMWVTNPKIEDAFKLVHFWGYVVLTARFWVKTKDGKPVPENLQVGIGHHTLGAHEQLWICVKGTIKAPYVTDRFPSVLYAPRGKHSEKPDEMYDQLAQMYPRTTKLSMFSRKPRNGWTVYGDQIKKTK